jgi:hypothetical protein
MNCPSHGYYNQQGTCPNCMNQQGQSPGTYGPGLNQQGYLNNQLGYFNPKDYVTREHFDKTIEELKKLITGFQPEEKK